MNPDKSITRHSRAGGNPAITNTLQSRQNQNIDPLARGIFNHLDSGLAAGQPALSLSKGRNDEPRVALTALCNMPCAFLTNSAALTLCIFALTASTPANAGELGRLFFTPEQRARLDYNYAREARPDSDNQRSLSVTGIVQKHGGERTIWINGVPKSAGKSDERSPESVVVPLPGQKKSVKLKVGQRVLLSPSASPVTPNPATANQAMPNQGAASQGAPDDD